MRRQTPLWLRTPQSKRVVEPDGPLDNPLIGLVDIAGQRLQSAEPVAAVKFMTGGDIADPRREREVIDAVAMEAAARGIDPDYVSAVFRDQIDATVALEYNRIAHWKRNPNAAPAEVQELSACRAIIDALNRTLVHEIALRGGSGCIPRHAEPTLPLRREQ